MPYQYQPLPVLDDSEDVYIRLLELHKGPPSGPITGQLYSTLLSEAPKFHALSYCWGPPTQKGTIHITNAAPSRDHENDNTLEIPATLIPLLYEIRGWPSLRARTLWVDSVCLNQKDLVEKTVHVPKMRQVYMKATITVSWLGLGEEGTEAAFKYASELHKTYKREMAEQKQVVLTAEEEKEEDVRVQVKLRDPALEALLKLGDRPYFKRSWIMQELVVSNQVWFLCGSAAISWTSLKAAYLYLMTSQLWIWEFYHSARLTTVVLVKISEMEWESGSDLDWPGTLLRHRPCLSSDPRDKVYAFYGMRCKRALDDLGIKPEYDEKITAGVLYTRLAARALQQAQIAVLHVPRLITTSKEEDDPDFKQLLIPSWVPDWCWTEATPMSLLRTELLTNDVRRDFHASNDSIFEASFDTKVCNSLPNPVNHLEQLPKLLKLHGVTVAKVTQLTPRCGFAERTSLRQSLLEQARQLQLERHQFHEWDILFLPRHAAQIYPATGEPATQAMYETLMAGETHEAPETKRKAYAASEKRERLLRLLHTFRIHRFLVCYILVVMVERVLRHFGWVNPEVQYRSMIGHMLNRKGARMFNVKESDMVYNALVPGLCQLGDHVVLVGGVSTPLILRKREGTTATWEFIGDAYVRRIMKGELWEKRKGDGEDMWILLEG